MSKQTTHDWFLWTQVWYVARVMSRERKQIMRRDDRFNIIVFIIFLKQQLGSHFSIFQRNRYLLTEIFFWIYFQTPFHLVSALMGFCGWLGSSTMPMIRCLSMLCVSFVQLVHYVGIQNCILIVWVNTIYNN